MTVLNDVITVLTADPNLTNIEISKALGKSGNGRGRRLVSPGPCAEARKRLGIVKGKGRAAKLLSTLSLTNTNRAGGPPIKREHVNSSERRMLSIKNREIATRVFQLADDVGSMDKLVEFIDLIKAIDNF
jgi:hypothetical protein